MAIEIYELQDSRPISEHGPPILRMGSKGEPSEIVTLAYFYWNTPQTYIHPGIGKLWRQDIFLQPDGHARFIATIPYGKIRRESGKFSFSFDTAGATHNIKCARAHVADYATTGNNINKYGGLINATPDGVEGCDIILPALRLTCQFSHPEGVLTIARMKSLAGATGCTNSDSFIGFEPGELLFAGASGADGTDTDMTVTYQFLASQNITNQTHGPITGIDKKGHEYLWHESEPFPVSGAAARKLVRVHVERVYPSIDFADTFGWS